MDWSNKVVLVTGGTGSFGKKFIEIMLNEYHPAKIIVLSRDELKQYEMQISGKNHPCMRYFIGDIRDLGDHSPQVPEQGVVGVRQKCVESLQDGRTNLEILVPHDTRLLFVLSFSCSSLSTLRHPYAAPRGDGTMGAKYQERYHSL